MGICVVLGRVSTVDSCWGAQQVLLMLSGFWLHAGAHMCLWKSLYLSMSASNGSVVAHTGHVGARVLLC